MYNLNKHVLWQVVEPKEEISYMVTDSIRYIFLKNVRDFIWDMSDKHIFDVMIKEFDEIEFII